MILEAAAAQLRDQTRRKAKDLANRLHRYAGTSQFPMRITGAVDVFKNDDQGRPVVLVKTSRPCAECGRPLVGMVVNVTPSEQVHTDCLDRLRSRVIIPRSADGETQAA